MPPPARGAAPPEVTEPDEGSTTGGNDTEVGPDADAAVRGEAEAGPWWRRRGVLVAGLAALLALPLLVAAIALRSPRWFPILDLAMTELRVRDVGGSHTPLIGLPGRIGTLAEQGSHPGPLSFWALAPVYWLFGSTAWALQAATVILHAIAAGLAVWIGARRGGIRLALAVALLLALLMRGYGVETLTEPWNPYLPLLWWIVVLLAVWSVLCRDLAMLPVAVFAASFCAQTHVPYLPLAVGMGGLALIAAIVEVRRRGRTDPGDRRPLGWLLAGAAVVVVFWLPPVIDELTRSPGNLSILVDHFASPPEKAVGPTRGIELLLLHLNAWRFLVDQQSTTGSLVDASQAPEGSTLPGLAVLAMWAGSVVVAWRLAHRRLLTLHLVVGVGLVLGFLGMSRIFGKVWYYLMLWAWGLTGLLLLAVGWTLFAALRRRLPAATAVRVTTGAVAVALAATMASTLLFAVDTSDAEPPAARSSATLGRLLPPTMEALEDGVGAATGKDGRYIVTWTDALYIGSQGYGLVSELERAGFDAGVDHGHRAPVTEHRVIDPDEVTAVVHFATGPNIERWRNRPGVVEVAFLDPRSVAEQRDYAHIRADVLADLDDAGLDDVKVHVDENLFGAAIDERVAPDVQAQIQRLLDLGGPTAIFVAPPTEQP